MVVVIGILLVMLIGGYIGYPFFIKKVQQQQTYTNEELQRIGEELEQEILVLRKYILPAIWLIVCVMLIAIGSISGQSAAQQTSTEKPAPALPENITVLVSDDTQERNQTEPLQYLGLLLLGLLLYEGLYIYKRTGKSEQPSLEILENKRHERQQLLYDIANFDDQYARGMIAEQAYLSERKRMKQRLVELTILCKALLEYNTPT